MAVFGRGARLAVFFYVVLEERAAVTALGRETGGVRRTVVPCLCNVKTESSWLTMTETPRNGLRRRYYDKGTV